MSSYASKYAWSSAVRSGAPIAAARGRAKTRGTRAGGKGGARRGAEGAAAEWRRRPRRAGGWPPPPPSPRGGSGYTSCPPLRFVPINRVQIYRQIAPRRHHHHGSARELRLRRRTHRRLIYGFIPIIRVHIGGQDARSHPRFKSIGHTWTHRHHHHHHGWECKPRVAVKLCGAATRIFAPAGTGTGGRGASEGDRVRAKKPKATNSQF